MGALQEFWFVQQIVIPALDVLLLAFLLYRGYQILVQTRAVQLVRGALFLGVLYAVSFFLNLRTVLWIINLLAPSFVIGIAIIFQPELRKIFTRIGQGTWLHGAVTSQPQQIDAVVLAASQLAELHRGALVVFTRTLGHKSLTEQSVVVDAEISSQLLVTFFSYDTPLHDGAVIIENGRIAVASALLPLSEQVDIRRSFGTRHRAALGMAEETDAVVVVVSEENGTMSLAVDGNLHYNLTADELREQLAELLNVTTGAGTERSEEVADLAD